MKTSEGFSMVLDIYPSLVCQASCMEVSRSSSLLRSELFRTTRSNPRFQAAASVRVRMRMRTVHTCTTSHNESTSTTSHNEIRLDLTANLLTEVCSNVSTEPELQPITSSERELRTENCCGALCLSGFWLYSNPLNFCTTLWLYVCCVVAATGLR